MLVLPLGGEIFGVIVEQLKSDGVATTGLVITAYVFDISYMVQH